MTPLPITPDQTCRILEDCTPTKPHRDPKVFCATTDVGEFCTHHGFHNALGHFAIIGGGISSEAWICCEAAPASITGFFEGLDAPTEDELAA